MDRLSPRLDYLFIARSTPIFNNFSPVFIIMALELLTEDRVDEKESDIIPSYKGKFPIAMLRQAWDDPEYKAYGLSTYHLPTDASFGKFIRAMRRITLEPKSAIETSK